MGLSCLVLGVLISELGGTFTLVILYKINN